MPKDRSTSKPTGLPVIHPFAAYEVLESQGLDVILANAREARAVPGRKIAVLFYNAMRYGMDDRNPGADHYEQQYRDRDIKQLHQRAAQFGFALQPQDPQTDG